MPLASPEEMRRRLAGDAAASEEDEGEQLPPQTTLRIDVAGSRGKRYQGTFVFRVPTLGDQVEIGRLKAAYLPDGAVADRNADLIAMQICYLEVTIQKTNLPKWWKPFEMYDAAPVSALYMEAINYERRFHGRPALLPANQGSTEEPAEDASGDPEDGGADMGEAVQPTAQRRKAIITHSSRSD